ASGEVVVEVLPVALVPVVPVLLVEFVPAVLWPDVVEDVVPLDVPVPAVWATIHVAASNSMHVKSSSRFISKLLRKFPFAVSV
ncbi:MAG: hypothetical protein JO187_06685, partial [Acidobacteria bacterium]|nr:hypothetical protein [Acidobacteriota bacterium]